MSDLADLPRVLLGQGHTPLLLDLNDPNLTFEMLHGHSVAELQQAPATVIPAKAKVLPMCLTIDIVVYTQLEMSLQVRMKYACCREGGRLRWHQGAGNMHCKTCPACFRVPAAVQVVPVMAALVGSGEGAAQLARFNVSKDTFYSTRTRQKGTGLPSKHALPALTLTTLPAKLPSRELMHRPASVFVPAASTQTQTKAVKIKIAGALLLATPALRGTWNASMFASRYRGEACGQCLTLSTSSSCCL